MGGKLIKPVGEVTERKPFVEAYVNHGRWVADCNRPYCNNAMALDPHQIGFGCANCGMLADIVWPDNADDIWEALALRPVPQTRNWFPKDHRLAIIAGCPHGQTVKELLAEGRAHGVKTRRR